MQQFIIAREGRTGHASRTTKGRTSLKSGPDGDIGGRSESSTGVPGPPAAAP